MHRATKSQEEIELLRALCDDATSPARSHDLMQSLRGRVFLEPEHQVVYESICFLLVRGGVSADRLTLHLNNRGFPDVDVEKYFPGARTEAGGKE